MKKIILIISLIAFAFSDQASWITRGEANMAVGFLNNGVLSQKKGNKKTTTFF